MDAYVTDGDFSLLAHDRCTFAVLDRILRGDCALIFSDHQSVIFCHSAKPYPVWIWTPEGAGEKEMEKAWTLAEQYCPLSAGFRFNLKYDLAEYFIKRAKETGVNAGCYKHLFAYECPDPVKPGKSTDGALHLCTEDDLTEAAALLPRFYSTIGEPKQPCSEITEKVRQKIKNNAFFFWKNAAGKTVALCAYTVNDGLGSVNDVFTLPEERRKHYAQNMVYEVTKILRDQGYTPMLYTNADYEASNACYQKIGYVLRGKLCTVAATAFKENE